MFLGMFCFLFSFICLMLTDFFYFEIFVLYNFEICLMLVYKLQ